MLELKHNVVGLTKAPRAMKIPVVVTSTTENMWGPLIPELAEALQDVPKIERTTVNAWTEKRVVDAVKAIGRNQLIVTGISTDVCLALPAISALADGYDIFGSSTRPTRLPRCWGWCGWCRLAWFPLPIPTWAAEILADNATLEAQAVYGALGMPFADLVDGLNQYFSGK
jgi:hypothetical protein